MYRERPSALAGAVVWVRADPEAEATAGAGAGGVTSAVPLSAPGAGSPERDTVRVLPDGCMDLIWSRGRLFVAGPDTRAHLVPATPGAIHVGLRFAPGTAPAVLGVPACELRDRRAALADLWPAARVRELTERLAAAPDPGRAMEALLRLEAERASVAGPDPVVPEIVAGAGAGVPVPEIAASTGLSDRQLRRRSLAAFGYPPSTLARILRLNRALRLARTGLPYATVAADGGYADQAHLAREVKALAGLPLSALLTGA